MTTEEKVVLVAGHWTNNAAMVEEALRIHALDTEKLILDTTYGKGNFWNAATRKKCCTIVSNDAYRDDCDYTFDFRAFPDSWEDYWPIVVYDPPYALRGGRQTDTTFRAMNNTYGIHDAPTNAEEFKAMMLDGLRECERITAPGGLLLVKCSDYVSSGRRLWQLDDLNDLARGDLGLKKLDKFIFYTKSARKQPPRTRKDGKKSVQQHARNNTSELIIYRKPKVKS